MIDIKKFYERDLGYDFESLPKYVFKKDSYSTRDLILEHLERKKRFTLPDDQRNYFKMEDTLFLMGFYYESDIHNISKFTPYGCLHVEIFHTFKQTKAEVIVVSCAPDNWLFAYQRPHDVGYFLKD
jgi:hypothetical protein